MLLEISEERLEERKEGSFFDGEGGILLDCNVVRDLRRDIRGKKRGCHIRGKVVIFFWITMSFSLSCVYFIVAHMICGS